MCDKGTCALDPSIIREERREGEGCESGEDPWKQEGSLSQWVSGIFCSRTSLARASLIPKSALGDFGWLTSRPRTEGSPTPKAPPRGLGLRALLQAPTTLAPAQEEEQAVRGGSRVGTATWGHLSRPPTTQGHPPERHSSLSPARPGHLRTFARRSSFHLSQQTRVGSASGAACSTALLRRCPVSCSTI